ncbi:hypothetical protein F5B19DRAFT_505096 [Rostrohypoxylon terebratum]|nr:hypothetical protein F5B19DRAFT_505096 [Rostrohypoxylon terebratum]
MAQDVFSRTEAWKIDDQAIDKVSDTLVTLLEALVANYEATSGCIYNAMMVFIHEQRSCTDAQALSYRDYMAKAWPHTGQKTITLLQKMLKNGRHHREHFLSPSPLQVSSTIVGPSVIIKARGIPEFLVELVEQVAWLGAALQPSPPGTGVFRIKPRTKHIGSSIFSKRQRVEQKFAIKYQVEDDTVKPQSPEGRCWHPLFVNPIIVQGFPISERCETGTGLEMPLNMLVELAGARYIDTFQSRVFIKGFSTMLVPTKQSGDLLCWHLLLNSDPNKRISYLDCDIENTCIEMNALEHYRHVLGWCSDALSIAGTTRANYDIGNSRLSHARAGCALERASISGGYFVTGTASFSLGNRDKPVHISRSGYLNKLQWISTKYFVFWDEEEKRGWFVNGTSTLLHILRKSISYSQQKFRSAWLLDPNDLKDALGEPRSSSALDVLTSDKNRGLKLYLDRSEMYDEHTNDQQISRITSKRQTRYYRLEDQIEHIYGILEKLIDYQTDAERRSGLEMKIQVYRQLEGWDFKDLATGEDPFFPRVTQLQVMGKGWVDFTRALHAVTLFGRGFGDLIQPQFCREKTAHCSLWSAVPSNRYYLAACISDLQEIMENKGDPNSKPRRLCENIEWYMNQTTYNVCPCTMGRTRKHHDPIQILFPRKFMTNVEDAPQVELEAQGAVIFGYNTSIGWHGQYLAKSQIPQELGDAADASSSRPGSSVPTRSSTPTHSPVTPLSTPDITPPNILKRTYDNLHNILPTNRKKRKSFPEAEDEIMFD